MEQSALKKWQMYRPLQLNVGGKTSGFMGEERTKKKKTEQMLKGIWSGERRNWEANPWEKKGEGGLVGGKLDPSRSAGTMQRRREKR